MAGTILVVEDEAHLAGLLSDILHASGYEVVLATPSQAAQTALQVTPAAIVMDYIMPGLNGGEVAEQIRAAYHAQAPPVILITGLPNARELAEQTGAHGYLRKPFDVDRFVQMIDDLASTSA
ncbi:MAG: response regulator [Chloroflexota bacterium]